MKIEHTALVVKDLEKEAAFFEQYFDGIRGEKYENPRTGFSSYFIKFNEGPRLELCSWKEEEDPAKPANRTGFGHLAFSAGSKEDVDRLTKAMKDDGYEIVSGPRTTGDGYYESCILDPEGNRLEITV